MDLLIRNVRLFTAADPRPAAPGFVAIAGGRIAQLGGAPPHGLRAADEIDGQGGLLTPGLIDCHTHLVYAGDRAREFELRLQGASYEDIARAGGGIRQTVRLTREADEATLEAAATRRLRELMHHGVSTVEI